MNGPDDYEGFHDYDMYSVYWWKSDFMIPNFVCFARFRVWLDDYISVLVESKE